jgi:O-antigen/teichoic acid export membrane protein
MTQNIIKKHNDISYIAKNTSFFTLALILQKIISFSYFAILARNLEPVELGKYYFAISFTTIFAIFIDLGLANVLTREVAKQKNKAQYFLDNILAIKIPLAALTVLIAVIIINLMKYPALTRHLVYLSAISMVLDSFTLTFFAVIRGFHNLKFESLAVIIFQVIILTLGLAVLKMKLNLLFLMGALVMASTFNFFYSFIVLKFKWRLQVWPQWEKRLIRTIIAITIPFALFAIFQRLYMYLDTVFLSKLAGDYYVGLYQIAFKIIFALQFLPMAFMASLYPAFASYWKEEKEAEKKAINHNGLTATPSRLVISFERAINYLIIISLPISIGIIALADKIILFFKSEYMEAVLPLRLVMVALFFIFINFPIGALLNACDRQKINTRNMGITLVVSIILNLILIPRAQAIGAAITVVLTNILMFILGVVWVPRIIKVRIKKILSVFWRGFLAVAIMAVATLTLKETLNIFLVVTISGLLYFLVLFFLGGFKKEDIFSIFQSFQ